MTASILAPVEVPFRALAATFVPELADAPPQRWEAVITTVETALQGRPPALRRQLVTFIQALDVVSRLRFRRSLANADPAQRLRLLRGFERSPLLAFRRGVWGLRTLVFMGYYTQAEVTAALGYRASKAGWHR